MKSTLSMLLAIGLVMAAVGPSFQKTECERKREQQEQLVKQQEKNPTGLGGLAVVVPNCNEDGSYATLQCHYGSQFCQCWDKEGYPLTSPKKNLKKCSCLVDRAKALKSVPPSQTDMPELTSCEIDGSYTAKQCNRSACWCVNPDTGKKLSSENRDKSSVKC